MNCFHYLFHVCGERAVLADANFPTSSICRDGGAKEIRADGHQIPAILEAILQLMPLDTYCWSPVSAHHLLITYYHRVHDIPN